MTELYKAVGLHHAMYLIPLLNAALVVVLFAASRTVTKDHLRRGNHSRSKVTNE